MKFKILFILIAIFLGGCKTTPLYESKNLDSNFAISMKQNSGIGVVRFDSWVTDELNNSGGIGKAFGLIGALVDYANDDTSEAFAINLQNESMKLVSKQFSKINTNYIDVDFMKKHSVSELTKRFKSNRMWGMNSVKSDEVQKFFTENPNAEFALHIKSQAAELSKNLWSETSWVIYSKNLKKVGEVNTRSVEKLKSNDLTNNQKFKKIMALQQKNIDEFLRIIS